MSVTFGFYNSLNGDRKYDAEQFGSMFDGLINDGVFMNYLKAFNVTRNTNIFGVNVDTGRAWFNHTWTLNDSQLSLAIDPAEVLFDRIDAVVIEVNASAPTRENKIKIVKGVAASTPAKPTLQNSTYIHQYPIAYVRVRANATSISSSDITYNVGYKDSTKDGKCPYVSSPVYDANNSAMTSVMSRMEEIEQKLGQQAIFNYDEESATLEIITF